ncbi:FecR family protein [Oceanobacter sp. 4_MG-2023]|uniref:FecR family protein n=1 Tax=Oceanobacter sp. 4_MG-2023 TaxID=3062623 RepID=UPI00273590C7|nr:FecR family protein [Oceanobacter sp. 4_MG-2023]MDP2548791.1 FecR family protein [Oceanobacter sp. 4_MG-2023]
MARSEPASINRKILHQAALWHATLGDEQVTSKQRQDFERWRQQSIRHEQAFDRMASVWQQLDHIEEDLRLPAAKALQQATLTKRSTLPLVAMVTLSACWISLSSELSGLFSDYHTSHGQRQQITLNDGSEIILNTDSAIDVDFTNQQRLIHLKQGELYITVAADVSRPFVIQTEHATATALGTQYAVRVRRQTTEVVVTESKVNVCPEQTSPCVVTHQNEATSADNQQVATPHTVDADLHTAWTSGKLVVDNWPLSRLLAEISRYYPGPLLYSDTALQSIQVSGVFILDAPEQILTHLEHSLPIRVNRAGKFFAMVRPRNH